MRSWLLSLLPLLLLTGSAISAPVDRDGDGLPDTVEEALGSDPALADAFTIVIDRRATVTAAEPVERACRHFAMVECAHAGGNRFLWRITFAAPPQLDDTVLHLYVDADADTKTGRQGAANAPTTGIDYMLSVVAGTSRATRYSGTGRSIPAPQVSHAIVGNSVVLSADVDLARDRAGASYGLYVLCHTVSGKTPSVSFSSPRVPVTGIALTDRPKIFRPIDCQQNWNVESTFGEKNLHAVENANDAIVVPHDALNLDHFAVDLETSNRWPHVTRQGNQGRVSTAAPKAGRFHVGFMMYDDSSDSRVGIEVNGKLVGVVVANQDNQRTWLYWTTEAFDFRGGETVALRAFGPSGKHGICNVLFLPKPPAPRKVEQHIANVVTASPFEPSGRVIVSWTTTWPSPTRLEYGIDKNYGKVATSDAAPTMVHRVVLNELDVDATYHARVVAQNRDESPVVGNDFTFRWQLPAALLRTRAGVQRVSLRVDNPHPSELRAWPVTTGIPLPQGILLMPHHVRLIHKGEEVPAQVSETARWRDGSVKWILVTFLAAVPAHGHADYELQFGVRSRRERPPHDRMVVTDQIGVWIDTGAVRFRIDRRGNLSDLRQPDGRGFAPRQDAATTLVVAGVPYTTRQIAEVTIEENGPVRVVVKTVSTLENDEMQSPMRVEKRVEAYAGLAAVRVTHTVTATAGDPFLPVQSLTFRVPVAQSSWQLPLAAGKPIELGGATPAVRQRFDNEYVRLAADGSESPSAGRLVGAALAPDGQGFSVVLRDCWQNYPKAFRTDGKSLEIGLLPSFAPGLYDKFPFEREGHHLYYYLLNGVYRLKRGVAKTDEFWIGCEPALAQLVQRPLLATAPPEWYCNSRAFYDVAPRNPARFRLYEDAIDKNLAAYIAERERIHDFGALNYGDWYPERGANWGNEEYDTQHAFFLEYIRSGNPLAFFLGEAHELHNRDVDTRHDAATPDGLGAVYIHQMGHVGGFYDKSVPGTLGFPESGFTVSHAWAEGHFDHYFLTGDRRSFDTGRLVADYFIRHSLSRPYDFLSCREPGWQLIMLAATYAATNDPYYLNAARVIVDRVLEAQDTEPRPLPAYQHAGRKPFQLGGWSRMLVPGHCTCEPRHRGNAGFMVAVLLSGMKYYHDVTGDEAVKQAIIRGAYYLLDETYSDEVHGFRYTSCPNTRYVAGASPLMVEGIARAYLWTKDERFRRVLTEALPLGAKGSPYGKSFSMYYRMAPRVLADLEAAGLNLNPSN